MSINLAELNKDKRLKQDGFTFKRFFVAHDKSPMKITTDSVLLGAWVPLAPIPQNVLDIGTGCGVIALMLAQRLEHFSQSIIEAMDIDVDAVKQCQENIKNSPFTRIFVEQKDIKSVLLPENQFNHQPPVTAYQKYDLIVSNPPYFQSAVACRNEQRQSARYTEQLSHAELFECVAYLLTQTGNFCVVLPFHLLNEFTQLGKQYRLYLSERLDVRYTEDKDYSLVLCRFSRQEERECLKKDLCMRHLDKSYTEAFARLLKDFYLRF